MIAFDRDGVLVGVLGNWEAGHPKNYKGAQMPLIQQMITKVPDGSIIISNQAGVARGYTSLSKVMSQFDWLLDEVQPNFLAAFFCPDEGHTCWFRIRHGWTKTTSSTPIFRKPNAGMGLLAQEHLGTKIATYVGDLSGNPAYAGGRNSDWLFAQNLGCKYLDVNRL